MVKPLSTNVKDLGGEPEISQFEEVEGTEFHGVQEGEDGTSDEGGDGVEGQGEMAPPDLRVRAGSRNSPTQKAREEHEATHVPFRDWCTHCMMGRGTHPSPRHQTKERGSIEKTHN